MKLGVICIEYVSFTKFFMASLIFSASDAMVYAWYHTEPELLKSKSVK
jgi:hypothetical protein